MTLHKRIILKLMSLGFFNWMPTKPYIKWKFKLRLGYKLNLNNPKTFNEKLNWLKVNEINHEQTKYVDKYTVRKYIADSIGEEYLVPLIGVYDTVDEIPWETLPEKFVLKCTTGSGGNIICTNKNECNINKSKKKLNSYLNKNYFYLNRETPYKQVNPKIICEQFISDTNITPNDYKVYCFNGKAKLLEFHIDRFNNQKHTCDYYDTNLNKLDFRWGTTPSEIDLPYKDVAKFLIHLSEEIAKSFIHVRVDWYVVANKIYFGETTFFNGGGYELFNSYEDDLLLGSWLKLPIDKK